MSHSCPLRRTRPPGPEALIEVTSLNDDDVTVLTRLGLRHSNVSFVAKPVGCVRQGMCYGQTADYALRLALQRPYPPMLTEHARD